MDTMSSSSGPRMKGRNMLYRLPDELLIGILEFAPSLSALWSLINSSGRLAAIFRRYGAQITEAVMRSTLPAQTQGLMKAVLQLRAGRYPSSLAQAREMPCLRPGPPIGAVGPDVVRGAVRLAHEIHALAYECICHYIDKCTRMSAEELANPALIASGAVDAALTWMRPAGQPQQLQHTGNPLLVEEQLVAMNLWRLQYVVEVRAAASTERLRWSAEDRQDILSNHVWWFYRLEFGSYKEEQLQVVRRYVHRRGGILNKLPLPLTTPHLFDVPYAPSHRTVLRLEYKPRGWALMTGILRGTNCSPLYGVTLGTYRKYGFAVFHDRRMVDLGLLPP